MSRTPDSRQDKVLAWMDETGSGVRLASREFGIPESTIKSWRRRRRRKLSRQADAAVQNRSVDAGESRRDFLVRSLGELQAAKAKATPGQLPALMKQEGVFHAELLELEEAAKLAAGEFADPIDFLEQILDGLETGLGLLSVPQVERLETLTGKARRLAAAARSQPTTPPPASDDPRP